jgi:hypothetical protein
MALCLVNNTDKFTFTFIIAIYLLFKTFLKELLLVLYVCIGS